MCGSRRGRPPAVAAPQRGLGRAPAPTPGATKAGRAARRATTRLCRERHTVFELWEMSEYAMLGPGPVGWCAGQQAAWLGSASRHRAHCSTKCSPR
eukprot:315500-Prymnesium_polylepis.2